MTTDHAHATSLNLEPQVSRRALLTRAVASAALLCFPSLLRAQSLAEPPQTPPKQGEQQGNFAAIYGDELLRERFKLFLKNVYHLYPEEPFHKLITTLSKRHSSDQEVYEGLLNALPDLQPFLGSLRFALPALAEQKRMMLAQTLTLLNKRTTFERYLSIGTTGRYYDDLGEALSFERDPLFVSYQAPTYGLNDVVERGQLSKMGEFYELADYLPLNAKIEPNSVDLMTVYIGFHHATLERREAFIDSCARALKVGGVMIVRDHDVFSPEYDHLVALAHDVFNAGLGVSWRDNAAEVRHFTSVPDLTARLAQHGLSAVGPKLLQPGDPTLNTLMRFDKLS